MRNLQFIILEKSVDRYRGISDMGGSFCIHDIHVSHSLRLPSLDESIWLVLEESSFDNRCPHYHILLSERYSSHLMAGMLHCMRLFGTPSPVQ